MKTFEEIYSKRPDKNEFGSSGYSNLKNLYDLCVRLKPELIVESGVYKGNSSWVFRHFTESVVCHDIDFSNLLFKSDKIAYCEYDIEEDKNFIKDGAFGHALFYFDDHISQKKRLKFLLDIGAKHAVFDDNQPSHIAKTLKNPASPTLEMLLENHDVIMHEVKHYEVMPYHGNKSGVDTRLSYIEL